MNCHQLLSGACNAGDRCFSIGSVEGVPFTAYAAGCNIVILASTFERVQIIPGATHGYVKISALDCSTDTGKIAASYDNKICIFEPTPVRQVEKQYTHLLDYRWVQTGSFLSYSNVITLSWNLEGTRLLTGGTSICLWKEKSLENLSDEPSDVKFVIGGGIDKDLKTPISGSVEDFAAWEIIWSCQTAIPVYHMAFSPDGTLFATCGRNDRLVKIWYENKQVIFPSKNNEKNNLDDCFDLNYTYVYIAHPRAVTNITWRKTSKYMPKGSVSNMLVTSCLDNICRIWIETVLPDDGLVNMTQFDPLASQNPKFRTHRHKHRFMQRLKHMKTCFHIRRNAKSETIGDSVINSNMTGPIPSLPSSCSVHDFHSYGFHGTGVSPGMHFHLASSINAETDIPLVPSMHSSDPSNQNCFILHWLNNKEMHFNLQAETILQDLTKKVIDEENGISEAPHNNVFGETSEASKAKNLRSSKSLSVEDSNTEEYCNQKYPNPQNNNGGLNNTISMSNTTSLNSLSNDHHPFSNKITDSLDIKIECLLRDWHQSPDLLFAIHPVDGSYLIWVVEWLDDYYPGLFRQAQISFSTRIPSAFPLGDAMSMSTTVSLYNTGFQPMIFKDIANVKTKDLETECFTEKCEEANNDEADAEAETETENEVEESQDEEKNAETSKGKNGSQKEETNSSFPSVSPSVSMVTKHSNGSLNLWQLKFAFKTKFTQVLSIGHVSRASGHRFRVNDITCHPVLPLLVSTSHHNITDAEKLSPLNNCDIQNSLNKNIFSPSGFCSELILWRVDSVGPLCHSGGLNELARINSPEISAFSNVAWIPTLLPSTTLGSYSNSPSACFVASDGENLRIYQAVIDARTLLGEISSETLNKFHKSNSFNSIFSNESSSMKAQKISISDRIKVVSQQSTARPGCIIQLDIISDAKHDWQNTQFLHVFQSQLITGSSSLNKKNATANENSHGFLESSLNAMVDLQKSSTFQEPFYIVVIEKTAKASTIHMWKVIISSKEQAHYLSETALYVPDSNLTQDTEDNISRKMSLGGDDCIGNSEVNPELPHIAITTEKVCTQILPLPDGIDVIHASPAAGHLSSSSIYPACFAPYIIVTACSDSVCRFWKCEAVEKNVGNEKDSNSYLWSEWKMFSKQEDSAIEVPGQPLNISAAYSGRIACAYKYGKSFTRPHKGDPNSRYVNLSVAVYECESTGGSEWVLEDTIHLKNIHLPRINIDQRIDLSFLQNNKVLQKKQRINQVLHSLAHDEVRSPRSGETTPEFSIKSPTGLLAVPSFSTLQSLRKSIAENGNTCPLTQKHLVQLDWVSKEDGSHILTVAVGSKIMLYTPVSSDIAQANIKAMKESRSVNRPILRKASSLAQPHFIDEIRWMKLRQIDLQTADGLPPLPMQISWVRDGILVVAMDSEMHVYSQWKAKYEQNHSIDDFNDTRNLRDEDLRSIANESAHMILKSVSSMPLISKVSTANLQLLAIEKKRKLGNSASNTQATTDGTLSEDYMTDLGLFQASRIACPVLPQYHPKQLMELLNSGKIRWVKAILAHLVRCMNGPSVFASANNDDNNSMRQRSWSRSRTYSISYAVDSNITSEPRGSTTQIPGELMLDYAEITSIPPLPLWILLNADKETLGVSNLLTEEGKDYNDLFEVNPTEDNLDDLLDECDHKKYDRRSSLPEKQSISYFGPRQGQMLSRLLTHTHLPGLSSLDQMHLLALADTVATCNSDFADKFVSDPSKSTSNKENSGTDSLDDCGVRYLLAMKHFMYLLRCLPLNQRAQFQKHGIGNSNIVWAFHSESEEELLNLIPSYTKGDIKWSVLRELGVGFWLKNINTLRQCVEKLAKCAYQSKQDPLDAAIYYLAMKKKSIVWGLFRSKRDAKMTAFFSNNFSEDRWRKAALKNAFVLLGKQRFEHAVSFFLLANSLKDAIEVCINKLDDFQLALIISRLYEGDGDNTSKNTYHKLLCEHVLGYDENNKPDISKSHPDPFLRSMTFWILKKYQDSLNTLLWHGAGVNHSEFNEEDVLKSESNGTNPNVFNFYIYLRTHPLLVRQNLALTAQEKKLPQVVLSGFSYSGETQMPSNNEKQLQIEDSITPIERQLYFTTAHGHFKAGCPALALEVLNKLPFKVLDSTSNADCNPEDIEKQNLINTGIFNWEQSAQVNKVNDDTLDFDWSTPIAPKGTDEEFKLDWGENEDEVEADAEADCTEEKKDEVACIEKNKNSVKEEVKMDIMAQQLKFVACLKILMEELSTLATGFEVDGGQLRYQLYIWLEKEVEALKQLCNYCIGEFNTTNFSQCKDNKDNDLNSAYIASDKPTLHEILLQEKRDFEAKVLRAAKRKQWLKDNETLLRTLLSYCSLHSASGGGLASIRMELVLLLQELQQEKTQQQLLSPLPFPTTLPLLSACVAGNKTVIADPIKYLQSQTADMLQSIVDIQTFPSFENTSQSDIYILRDLAVALSSCIYQSLCDSESFVVKKTGANSHQNPFENIAKLDSSFECSHLIGNSNMFNRKRKYSTDETSKICTSPSKWPGVTNLRALLAREKDDDIPKLNILLLESFVATYMALCIYSLATCDCRLLYRLIAHNFSNDTWAILFGGGMKKLLRKATSQCQATTTASVDDNAEDNSVWNTVTSITKQRVKLNMKILGSLGNSNASNHMKEDKPTYREQFVPPEMSMLSYFLLKPHTSDADDYDTDDENYESQNENIENDDDDDDEKNNKENVEHINPNSYSWNILKAAIVKMISKKIRDFINVAGIEIQDLPVLSPISHEVLRTISRWEDFTISVLSSKGHPPENFIPGCYAETGISGLSIHKYRSILNKDNTPYVSHISAAPVRRLWNYLVRQEHVQDIFIKSIFLKRSDPTSSTFTKSCDDGGEEGNSSRDGSNYEQIRIIHKDPETIQAFCLTNNSATTIALANPKEIIELDISLLLDSPHWFEDECDYDLLNLSKDTDSAPNSGFLVVQSAEHANNIGTTTTEGSTNYCSQSGRGTSLVIKHKVDNVKKMSTHPLMPLYMTGGQDGSVQIWEWGHKQAVCTPRPSGTFAKVTRCRFSDQGNKFGIGDGDGKLSLWQAALATQNNRPFLTYQCHNKILSDFIFLGSCSLIATVGQSSENKNINIWDTLLSQKKACISAFTCHDQGASCVVFAPQHQVLISCGKRGDVCVFDMRQRLLKHRFVAHESAIKCIAIDPHEEFFATGSTEGDIKIWDFNQFTNLNTFYGEHAKNSFFKHMGQGVNQVHIDSFGRLFTCGTDGCMKIRQLIEKDPIVHSLY